MNKIAKFFHEIFHPHCEHCHNEKQDDKICLSCETLKRQLEISNEERDKLLERILEKPKVEERVNLPLESLRNKSIPWAVRKQMLESEDRKRAELLRKAPQPDTEELEKELGVNDALGPSNEQVQTG